MYVSSSTQPHIKLMSYQKQEIKVKLNRFEKSCGRDPFFTVPYVSIHSLPGKKVL